MFDLQFILSKSIVSVVLNYFISVFNGGLSAFKVLLDSLNAVLLTDIQEDKLVNKQIHALKSKSLLSSSWETLYNP